MLRTRLTKKNNTRVLEQPPYEVMGFHGKWGDQCWVLKFFKTSDGPSILQRLAMEKCWGTSAGPSFFSTPSYEKMLLLGGSTLVPGPQFFKTFLWKLVGLISRQEGPIAGSLCTPPLTHLPFWGRVLVPLNFSCQLEHAFTA